MEIHAKRLHLLLERIKGLPDPGWFDRRQVTASYPELDAMTDLGYLESSMPAGLSSRYKTYRLIS